MSPMSTHSMLPCSFACSFPRREPQDGLRQVLPAVHEQKSVPGDFGKVLLAEQALPLSGMAPVRRRLGKASSLQLARSSSCALLCVCQSQSCAYVCRVEVQIQRQHENKTTDRKQREGKKLRDMLLIYPKELLSCTSFFCAVCVQVSALQVSVNFIRFQRCSQGRLRHLPRS